MGQVRQLLQNQYDMCMLAGASVKIIYFDGTASVTQLRICRRVRRRGGGWQQWVHPELPGTIAGGDQDARHLHLRLHLRLHFYRQGVEPQPPTFGPPPQFILWITIMFFGS